MKLDTALTGKHSARVSISRAQTGLEWQIGLTRGPFSLSTGKYKIRFRARADGLRPLSLTVMQAHPPWKALEFYERVELTPLWTSFEAGFEVPDSFEQAQVQFNVGASRWSVEVSELSIIRLTLPARRLN